MGTRFKNTKLSKNEQNKKGNACTHFPGENNDIHYHHHRESKKTQKEKIRLSIVFVLHLSRENPYPPRYRDTVTLLVRLIFIDTAQDKPYTIIMTSPTTFYNKLSHIERELQRLKIEAYRALPKNVRKALYPESMIEKAVQETRDDIWQKQYAKKITGVR